jgi:hypothetical protein
LQGVRRPAYLGKLDGRTMDAHGGELVAAHKDQQGCQMAVYLRR